MSDDVIPFDRARRRRRMQKFVRQLRDGAIAIPPPGVIVDDPQRVELMTAEEQQRRREKVLSWYDRVLTPIRRRGHLRVVPGGKE